MKTLRGDGQMIDFYNAFISYKHADLDTKVAEHVQRNLERFRIPGKIKKKTGRKKIERIFRDKDELPITSDLTDTISNALEKAEYLIVICSPNTKQSIWVRREIQFFLRNHTKNQILTVLAGGEPQDVIPEELLSDERMVENEMGIKTSVKVPIEPLSCDYRMPFKKAKNEELPRLASALIGCSYDELVRRQRQYKMRRMGIIGAAVIAGMIIFGGYMTYSKMKIDKSYREQLISRSRYLANESENYLEDGQRIEALQLALAALPKDGDDDSPVTPEALRAITDATMAYTTNSGLSLDSVWNYQMPNAIDEFIVSPSGDYLAGKDQLNNVMVWNTKTHEIIMNKYYDGMIGMEFMEDDSFVLWRDKEVENYTMPDGNRRWNYVLDSDSFIREQLMEGKDFIILFSMQNKVMKYGKTDGKLIDTFELPGSYGTEILSCSKPVLSPDEKRFACECFVGDRYALGIYDLTTKRINVSATQEGVIASVEWGDDDHVLIATPKDQFSSSYSWGDMSVIKTDYTVIDCYNPSTLIKTWSKDMPSIGVMHESGFVRLPAIKAICYFHANAAYIYDVNTGDVIHGGNVYDSIVSASDIDGDGSPVYITKAGGFAMPMQSSGPDAFAYMEYFTNDLRNADVNGGVYVLKDYATRILYYKAYVCDDEFEDVDKDFILTNVLTESYIDNDILAVISGDDTGLLLNLMDPVEHKILNTVHLNDETYSGTNYNLLGKYNNEVIIHYKNVLDSSILAVDINTGNIRSFPVDQALYMMDDAQVYADGKYVCAGQDPDTRKQEVNIYDVADGKKMTYTLDDLEVLNLRCAPEYLSRSQTVYLSDKNGDFIVDIEKAKVSDVAVPNNWAGMLCAAEDETGSLIAVADNNHILIIDKDGSVERQISTNGMTPLGMSLHKMSEKEPPTLFVVYNSKALYRYDPETGAFIGSSGISTYDRFAYRAFLEFDDANKTLRIELGELCDIVETDTWIETLFINNYAGYCKENDQFFAYSYEDSSEIHLGYFKHYTLDDLKAKAQNILQGIEPSEDLKSLYGI